MTIADVFADAYWEARGHTAAASGLTAATLAPPGDDPDLAAFRRGVDRARPLREVTAGAPVRSRSSSTAATADPADTARRTAVLELVRDMRREATAAAVAEPAPAPARKSPVWSGALDLTAHLEQRKAPALTAAEHTGPPPAPLRALQFVDEQGTRRWSQVDHDVPGGRAWESLVHGLMAAGPLRSLRVHQDRGLTAAGADGEARTWSTPDGAIWAEVAVRPGLVGEDRARTVPHELAHIAWAVVRMERGMPTAAFNGDLMRNRHAYTASEAFAQEAETWVDTGTTAEELLAEARAHMDGRPRRVHLT